MKKIYFVLFGILLLTGIFTTYHFLSDNKKIGIIEKLPFLENLGVMKPATWNITEIVEIGNFTLGVEQEDPYTLTIDPTGTILHVIGGTPDRVSEYNITTAWDISTAVHSTNLATGSDDDVVMAWNDDGTKLVTGEQGLSSWTLSIPYRINSSTDGSDDFDPATDYTQSIYFGNNGSYLYAGDNNDGKIYQYNLSTPFDISSAVLDYTYESGEGVMGGIFFRADGLRMWSGDNDNDLRQWNLTTAWDLRTASKAKEYSFSYGAVRANHFSPNGEYLYVLDLNADIIHQYQMDDEFTEESISITLNAPENNSQTSDASVRFNASYVFEELNTTNATYYIYNITGEIFNKTTSSITPAQNWSILNVSGFSAGDYLWNVYACGENTTDTICNWSSSGNFTFEWIPFTLDAELHSNWITETSGQNFELNVSSADGYTISNGRLVYNGTTYSNAIKTEIDADSFSLIKTINIPPVNINDFNHTNITFYWNVSVTNEVTGATSSSITSNYNQTVSELEFEKCSTNVNTTILNFTLYDESTGNLIDATTNATSIQVYFDFGSDAGYKEMNYSFSNLSFDNNTILFCTDNSTRTIYTDMNGIFSAVDYDERNYYLDNSTLTNDSSEINLYLIKESASTEFFITITQNLRDLADAKVQVSKFFIGEGVYKTIEVDETDSNGEFNIYLDLDRDYKVTVTKDNSVIGTKTFKSSCAEAPCTISLDFRGDVYDLFGLVDSLYAENVYYNLSFNASSKIVTFDFVDTTGLANYFRMAVYNSNSSQDGILISNQSLYTSSGTITFNASNYTGHFYAESFVSRSPELMVDFIRWMISEIYDNFGDYTGEALLLMFLVILTFIFGLAFKPSVMMFSIPLIMHLGVVSGMFPLGMQVVTLFYAFAIIGVIAMKN